ncbi:helix-turn-helix domain-containing protein [Nocardia sp. NPDC058519]|uniref:helix-turn-helix domain-containing protein n=1 Tax=Nocardia sp. NPDC058519 TaxID=3346535 RepID=UPI003662C59B
METSSTGWVSANLRAARARSGITQAELAQRSGVSANSIARFERDERDPRVGQLIRIALALEVRPSSLIDKVESASEDAA